MFFSFFFFFEFIFSAICSWILGTGTWRSLEGRAVAWDRLHNFNDFLSYQKNESIDDLPLDAL